MIPRICQSVIAIVFLILGGWALIAPAQVIELTLTEQFRDTSYIMRFMMACFGAQAVMFGIMALTVKWSARAFLVFGVVLVPFFFFNWYFHYEVPVLTSIGMLDFAGNVIMLLACIVGYRTAKVEEQDMSGIRSL